MEKPQPARYPYVMPVPGLFGLGAHFAKGVACKVHHRDLPATKEDFAALGLALCGHYDYRDYMNYMGEKDLREKMPRLPAPAQRAAETVLQDMEELRARFNYKAELRYGGGYGPKGLPARFHADGMNVICAAYGDRNTQYLGQGDAVFAKHVGTAAFYEMREGARIHSFRAGDIWIQKGGTDPAEDLFVHRGPPADPDPKAPPRLLLVAMPKAS